MDKRELIFIKLLEEIAKEENIEMNTFSNYWIIELKKDNRIQYVLGYNFELNNAASSMLCNDKVGTSLILNKNNIPCVKHEMLLNPNMLPKYLIDSDQYKLAKDFLDINKEIVLKPNNGTGGKNVYKICSEDELSEILDLMFSKYANVAMAKFENIINEYRVIFVKDDAKIIYKKEIPFVIGDGIHNIKSLCEKYSMPIVEDDYIPAINEKYKLNWKHNLALGAIPENIDDISLRKSLSQLAASTCKALNILTASVDIIETADGLKVLEVNNGIMMDNYAGFNEENYSKAKEVYKEIIINCFEIL